MKVKKMRNNSYINKCMLLDHFVAIIAVNTTRFHAHIFIGTCLTFTWRVFPYFLEMKFDCTICHLSFGICTFPMHVLFFHITIFKDI